MADLALLLSINVNWMLSGGIVATAENPTVPCPGAFMATKKKGTKRSIQKMKELFTAAQERASPDRDAAVMPNLDVLGDVPTNPLLDRYPKPRLIMLNRGRFPSGMKLLEVTSMVV